LFRIKTAVVSLTEDMVKLLGRSSVVSVDGEEDRDVKPRQHPRTWLTVTE